MGAFTSHCKYLGKLSYAGCSGDLLGAGQRQHWLSHTDSKHCLAVHYFASWQIKIFLHMVSGWGLGRKVKGLLDGALVLKFSI